MEKINLDQLLELFGSPMLVEKYLDLFVTDIPRSIEEIKLASSQHDFASVAILAHGLKSQFKYIGNDTAATICNEIESASDQDLSPDNIGQMIFHLETTSTELIAYIQEIKTNGE